MNRLDRLFAITTYLQGRSRVRATDLADRFEVSKRTIYRDVAALSEAGVPIVSLPGEGYAIAEGFFLPPLVLTSAEATALVLGTRQLGEQATGRLAAAADQAVAKIAAVLTDEARRRVDELTEVSRFLTPARPRLDLDDPRLVTLRRAIRERRVVALRYHGRNRDEVTEREVEPRELAFTDGVWYLTGYCRLRQAERDFRLDRVAALDLLAETFVPRRPAGDQRRPVEVRVRFASVPPAGRGNANIGPSCAKSRPPRDPSPSTPPTTWTKSPPGCSAGRPPPRSSPRLSCVDACETRPPPSPRC